MAEALKLKDEGARRGGGGEGGGNAIAQAFEKSANIPAGGALFCTKFASRCAR